MLQIKFDKSDVILNEKVKRQVKEAIINQSRFIPLNDTQVKLFTDKELIESRVNYRRIFGIDINIKIMDLYVCEIKECHGELNAISKLFWNKVSSITTLDELLFNFFDGINNKIDAFNTEIEMFNLLYEECNDNYVEMFSLNQLLLNITNEIKELKTVMEQSNENLPLTLFKSIKGNIPEMLTYFQSLNIPKDLNDFIAKTMKHLISVVSYLEDEINKNNYIVSEIRTSEM